MKENDWIIAGITNPDKNPGQLRAFGLDLDNTQLLSKDEYLKSNYIKENPLFKDLNGQFSELKFTDFYNKRVLDFYNFATVEDDFTYDIFDYRRFDNPNSYTKDTLINIFRQSNPLETTTSHGFINQNNLSVFSDRERAEQNKVYDHATGLFLDYSPNDHSFTSSPLSWLSDIFKEPLVLAAYDGDGIDYDPITGAPFEYKKGLLKMNSEGKYYYETLDGRSLAGKQVLSGWDTLTVDGSLLNKIDVLDSDDREKSIAGAITRTALAVAPFFLGPTATALYSATLVTREILKSLPTIDGYITALLGYEDDTSFTRLSNRIAGSASRFNLSQSDYGNSSMMTFEGLSNLMSDVALQWGLQRWIAKGLAKAAGVSSIEKEAEKTAFNIWKESAPKAIQAGKLEGLADDVILLNYGSLDDIANWSKSNLGKALLNNATKDLLPRILKAQRLGADASLLYMSLVSNNDVYLQMLEHGTTKREAAAVAFMSTLGMFSVDRYLHLGEAYFNNLADPSKYQVDATLTNEVARWIKNMSQYAKDVRGDKKGTYRLLNRALHDSKLLYRKYLDNLRNHTLGFFGRAMTEGIEEVMEEVSTDISKELYQLAAEIKPVNEFFGGLTTKDVGAWSYDAEDPDWIMKMLGRYGMNFLGGFMGGGLFYGVDAYNGNLPKITNNDQNLLSVVRKYGVDRVMSELNKMHKDGKVGNKKLSARIAGMNDDEMIFLPASDENPSLNDAIYDILKNEIQTIGAIVNDETKILSDDELLSQMTMGELRFLDLALLTVNDYSKGLLDRYDNLVKDYVNVTREIKRIEQSYIDSKKNSKSEEDEQRISRLNARKKELQKQIDDFTSPDNAIDYMSMLLFALDNRLSSAFYSPKFDVWLQHVHREESDYTNFIPMTIEDFRSKSQEEQNALMEKYLTYKKAANITNNHEILWLNYKSMSDALSPEFTGMELKTKNLQWYLEEINSIWGDESPFSKVTTLDPDDIKLDIEEGADVDSEFKWDIKLDDESQSDYDNKDTLLDSETEEQFNERQEKRKKKLKEYYSLTQYEKSLYDALLKVEDIIEQSGSMIDPSTKRRLLLLIGTSQDLIVLDKVNNILKTFVNNPYFKTISEKLQTLKGDLSNFDTLSSDIREYAMQREIDFMTSIVSHKIDLLLMSVGSDKDIPNIGGEDIGLSLLSYLTHFEKVRSGLQNSEILKGSAEKFEWSTDTELANAINNFIDNIKLSGRAWLKRLSQDEIDSVNEKLSKNYSSNLNPYTLSDDDYSKLEEVLDALELSEKAKTTTPKSVMKEDIIALYKDIDPKLVSILTEDIDGSSIINRSLNLNKLLLYSHQILDNNSKIIAKKNDKGSVDIKYYKENFDQLFKGNLTEDDIIAMFSSSEDTVDEGRIISYLLGVNGIAFSLQDGKGLHLLISLDIEGNWFADMQKMQERINDRSFDLSADIINEITGGLSALRSDIERDDKYKYIYKVKNATEIENPILNIIRKLALSFQINSENIEDFLSRLMTLMNTQGFNKFTLTPKDRALLDDAYDLLDMARAFVYSVYNSDDIQNPYPHNQLTNQLIDKLGSKMKKLPVVSDLVALLYTQQIISLMSEIGFHDIKSEGGYNYGSWRFWDVMNNKRKDLKFIKASEELTKAHMMLFNRLHSDGSLKLKDGTDLLDGFEEIVDNTYQLRLYKVENLLYDNVQKYLKANPNISFFELLESSNLSKIFDEEYSFIELETSILDENIAYNTLTPMHKAMYLFKIMGIRSSDFLKFNKEFYKKYPKIVALDIQLQVARGGMAYVNNPIMYQQFIDWMYNIYMKHMQSYDFPITKEKLYSIFISGNGGAGKTSVCATMIAEFIQSKRSSLDSIVLTGPGEKQIRNLSELKIGNAVSLDEVLKSILSSDSYSQVQADLKSNNPSSWKVFKDIGAGVASSKKESLTFKNAKKSAIIIDEATHIPIAIQKIISEYCSKYNIPFITIGDSYQTGEQNKDDFEINNNAEVCFTGREDRLGITLRDTNIQKWHNIISLTALIKSLMSIPDTTLTLRKSLIKLAFLQFNDLSINYYVGDEINGDYIVTSLTEEDCKRLKMESNSKDKKFIAYIGTNQNTVSLLKRIHGEDAVAVFKTIKEIQGSEFDNVVVEVPFKLPNITEYSDASLRIANSFLKSFYTASTRGKKAAIFIDPNNKLSNFIHQQQDNFKSYVLSITKSLDNFAEYLSELYKLFNIEEEKDTEAVATIPEIPETVRPIFYSRGDGFDEGVLITGLPKNQSNDEIEDLNAITKNDSQTRKVEWPGMNQALVYGENTLSGMKYEEEEIEQIISTDTDDESLILTRKIKRRKYFVPDLSQMSDDAEISDAALFTDLDGGVLLYDPLKKVHLISKPVRMLRQLKDNILFNNLRADNLRDVIYIEGVNDDGIITVDLYRQILNGQGVTIELAPLKDTDNFVGLSQLEDKEDKMAVFTSSKGQKLVAKVVARWKITQGRLAGHTAKITLGMLADPNRYNNEEVKDAVKKRLKRRINDMNIRIPDINNASSSDRDLYDSLNYYLNNLDSLATNYAENVIEYLIEPYDQVVENPNDTSKITGFVSFDKKTKTLNLKMQGNIKFTASSEIRTTYHNHANAIPVLRLSNSPLRMNGIKPASRSFDEMNPDVTISPIYIYKPTRGEDTSYSRHIAGKAVVFVSVDPSLRGREEYLINEWNNQQGDSSHSHSVRMIRLDNIGCSMRLLAIPGIRNLFRVQEAKTGYSHKLPFEGAPMSARQIIELWNYRASMKLFLDEYQEEFSNDNDRDVREALIRLHEYYREKKKQDKEYGKTFAEDYIKENPQDTIGAKIIKFNSRLDKYTTFGGIRLGIGNKTPIDTELAQQKERNEFLIRRMNIEKGNRMYTDKLIEEGVYGIYITPLLAQKHMKLLDGVFLLLSQPVLGINVLVLDPNTKQFVTPSIETHIALSENENIMDVVNRTDRATIRLYGEDSSIKNLEQVSRILVKTTSKALAFMNTLKVGGKRILPNTGEYEDRPLTIEWRPELMNIERVYTYTYQDGKYKLNEDKKSYLRGTNLLFEQGEDFVDMLDLCFHGTTDNFIDKRLRSQGGNSNVTPLATDSFFKYGFFIDPLMESISTNITTLPGANFYRCATNPSLFTLAVKIDRPRFTFSFVKNEEDSQKEDEQQKERESEKSVIIIELVYDILNKKQFETIADRIKIEFDELISDEQERLMIYDSINLVNNWTYEGKDTITATLSSDKGVGYTVTIKPDPSDNSSYRMTITVNDSKNAENVNIDISNFYDEDVSGIIAGYNSDLAEEYEKIFTSKDIDEILKMISKIYDSLEKDEDIADEEKKPIILNLLNIKNLINNNSHKQCDE